MSFSIRPDRRFPICCSVTYHAGLREGHKPAQSRVEHWVTRLAQESVENIS